MSGRHLVQRAGRTRYLLGSRYVFSAPLPRALNVPGVEKTPGTSRAGRTRYLLGSRYDFSAPLPRALNVSGVGKTPSTSRAGRTRYLTGSRYVFSPCSALTRFKRTWCREDTWYGARSYRRTASTRSSRTSRLNSASIGPFTVSQRANSASICSVRTRRTSMAWAVGG